MNKENVLEIIAVVYAVCKDRFRDGIPVNVDIVKEALKQYETDEEFIEEVCKIIL